MFAPFRIRFGECELLRFRGKGIQARLCARCWGVDLWPQTPSSAPSRWPMAQARRRDVRCHGRHGGNRSFPGHDILYADSASHCLKYSTNGGSFTCIGAGGGGVTGSGTANTIPLWTGSTAIGNSAITQNTGTVLIGGGTPLGTTTLLQVGGTDTNTGASQNPAVDVSLKPLGGFGGFSRIRRRLETIRGARPTPYASHDTRLQMTGAGNHASLCGVSVHSDTRWFLHGNIEPFDRRRTSRRHQPAPPAQ